VCSDPRAYLYRSILQRAVALRTKNHRGKLPRNREIETLGYKYELAFLRAVRREYWYVTLTAHTSGETSP